MEHNLRESIDNQTDFSLWLAKYIISGAARGANFVFSPLSVHVVLGMVAAGSGGPTRYQLLGYLRSMSVEDLNYLSSLIVTQMLVDGGSGPRLSFGSGVWVDRSITLKPAFRDIVHNAYKAAANHVDFQNKADEVRQEVNAWVYNGTNGLIKDILPPGSVGSYTRLILANALYFKGVWKEKFDASLTRDYDFFLSNGGSVHAPFMKSYKRQYIRAFDGFKVLQLPYRRGEDERVFSLYIFLPDARDGLPALVEKFGSVPRFMEEHIPYQCVDVGDFRIPKFKINFGFEASGLLKGQGLVLPFMPGGLTEMVVDLDAGNALCVSAFFQKSFIEVDEEGTEAAAASAVVAFGSSSMYPDPVRFDFVADHPFLFVLREDMSGIVLFVGQVVDPLSH